MYQEELQEKESDLAKVNLNYYTLESRTNQDTLKHDSTIQKMELDYAAEKSMLQDRVKSLEEKVKVIEKSKYEDVEVLRKKFEELQSVSIQASRNHDESVAKYEDQLNQAKLKFVKMVYN